MDDKYSKYHGRIPGASGDILGPNGMLTDEEIENVMLAAKLNEERRKKILADSYGYDFVNIDHLSPENTAGTSMFWDRYISYAGEDPKNSKLRVVQFIFNKYQDEEVPYAEPITHYFAVTSWYDEFGFEVRREVRYVQNDLTQLKDKEPMEIITRENGIIKIELAGEPLRLSKKIPWLYEPFQEVIIYDTGIKSLPCDEYYHEYPYGDIGEYFMEHKGETLCDNNDMSKVLVNPIVACNLGHRSPNEETTTLTDEEILAKFREQTKYLRELGDPELNAYLDKKYEELQMAIYVQKKLLPIKKEMKTRAKEEKKTEEEMAEGLDFIEKKTERLIMLKKEKDKEEKQEQK